MASTTPPFKKVILVGAGGSAGAAILKALLAEPQLETTILARESSKSKFPEGVKVIKIADSYAVDDLVAAFQGQDAVLNAMATVTVKEQYRFIDAAIAARVRRYMPSEFGLDNSNRDAQELTSIFADKGAVQRYLRDKAAAGKIEWMSIASGMWVAWSVPMNFMGMDVPNRRFTVLDNGEGLVSCSPQENVGLAVARALVAEPELTRDRALFLQSFVTSQNEMVLELEKQLGEKFTVEHVNSDELIEKQKAQIAAGNLRANGALVNIAFMTGRYSGHFEKNEEILDEKLGLPKTTLAEQLAEGLRRLKA